MGPMLSRLRRFLFSRGRKGDPEMVSCEQALRRLFEYLDGELDDGWREGVRTHLEVCRRCYPHLLFEQSFLDLVSRTGRAESAPPGFRDRVVEALATEGFGSN